MENMHAMNAYIGTKLITARPMTRGAYNDYRGWTIPADENPEDEGYLVRYSDNYESWSPKDAFEEAYRPTNAMNFGLAIEAAKKGKKIAREGWNGKGMYVFYSVMEGRVAGDPILPFLGMRTVQGNVCLGWLASQTDILADDWYIVE